MIKVTSRLIEQGKSAAGGWNARQLRYIKVRWPLTKGWKDRAVGTEITEASAEQFLAMRGTNG